MKKATVNILAFLMILSGITQAQQTEEINLADSTGLPGDHFSLEGALAVFKESKSLEEFEKKINSKDDAINNLDLNGDGNVDYIKIVTAKKEDAHVIILQAPVSKTETQDVAVIEIEKDGDESAFLQIVGDKDLYGESKIVEPKGETEVGDPGVGERGPAAFSPGFFIHVNVWFWPCIRFMYAPAYVVYYSPWYWGYYPRWWSPWHPYPWSYHYMHTWHHHHHYHSVYHHRTTYAHQVYAPRRTTSVTVHNRYDDRIKQYRSNNAVRPTNNNVSPGRPKQSTQTRPVSKPSNNAVRPGSTTRPVTKPQTRPATKPASRPVTKPAKGGGVKSQPDRGTRNPQVKPKSGSTKNQVKPSYKQPTRSTAKPQGRSNAISPKGATPARGASSSGRKR